MHWEGKQRNAYLEEISITTVELYLNRRLRAVLCVRKAQGLDVGREAVLTLALNLEKR